MSATAVAILVCAASILCLALGWMGHALFQKPPSPSDSQRLWENLAAELGRTTRERDEARKHSADLLRRIADERDATRKLLSEATRAEVDQRLSDLGLRK